MLTAREVILSDRADAALALLQASSDKEAASILRRVAYLRERLLADCQEGEVVRFPLPRTARPLQARHSPLGHLYCIDLPDFWRLLYTLVRADGQRYVYVLEIVSHPQYSKWFPGRGR